MATIDFKQLVKDMLTAAKGHLGAGWKEARPYAESEFKAFAENIKLIEKLKLAGTIDEERARLHMNIQKNSIRMVLLTIEGIGILAVENAINAAISVVQDTVNKALGWSIL